MAAGCVESDPSNTSGLRVRCPWAEGPWLRRYHDREWGVPVHQERGLFELLVLEGAQAGLSWLTVLKRRDGYRVAFADFDPVQVAGFDSAQVEALLSQPGIIRHRQKVEAAISNAAALLRIREEAGSFDEFIWGFVEGKPLRNRWANQEEVPATTPLARRVSAELRERGFRFVGPTICYSFLQAAGLVLDHLTSCFRYAELGGGRPGPP
ncbi:MAG TPA: DNA-3-methyladenine glycosylase I [Candidatus Dormibacteraeota bacterium]|nr:DNA-3-methyladenine glycosylase I [Candidatus Dormibacteraeota bacterium]